MFCSYISNSPASTLSLGRRLGVKLEAGSILALIGELGCGKTLFARGLCSGLGVPPRYVNSPTFVLVNEYPGRLPVFHMDLYRINRIEEAFEIGLMDYLARAESGVIIIEWAERVKPVLPESRLEVTFRYLSPSKRRIEFAASERFRGALEGLCR